MKHNLALTTLLSFFLVCQVIAQPNRGGGPPKMEFADNTGGIGGMIIDDQTQEAISFANIVLYKSGETELLSGVTSDDNGRFLFKDIAYGDYDLVVSFLGYEDAKTEQIQISVDKRFGNAGRIKMFSSSANLKEVEVTAERAAVEYGLDRKVFNVEKDIASTGGSAEDLLRNIPSITMDLDGNISLRGSQNIRILINGKPSGLTGLNRQAFLQQIAANNIQSIEVLTNPSAKYQADGMGGIINIITKRQNRRGFNLSTAFNVGTNNKLDGNINANYRQGRFNYIVGYSGRYDERFFRGERFNQTMTSDTLWFLEQDINGDRVRESHTMRGGLEYFPSGRSLIGVNATYTVQNSDNRSFRISDFLDDNQDLARFTTIDESEPGDEDVFELSVDYNQRFRREGQELSFRGQYTNSNEFETTFAEQIFLNPTQEITDVLGQRNPADDQNQLYLAQLDFVRPFKNGMKLETGWRTAIRRIDNDAQFFVLDQTVNEFVFDQNQSNRFLYDEDVHAAYAIVSGKKEAWGYQFGLRAEQTYTTAATIVPTDQTFNNDYLGIFPSGFVSYDFSDLNSIQVSYSRRINRPRYRALNPFVDRSDTLNLRTGNPFLLPEFINSYELNYLRSFKKGSISVGLYLREIRDIISRFTENDASTGVSTRSFVNLNQGRNYGMEIVGTIRPSRKVSFNISGNAYRTEVDASNQEADLNAAGYLFRGRIQSNITILKDLGMQISGFYRSPGVRPQGEIKAIYSVDFGLRKPIMKGKGNLTLRATDIFNTRRFRFITSNGGIVSEAEFQRESRILYLGFNYSLRKEKSRRNRRGGGRERGGDDMEF